MSVISSLFGTSKPDYAAIIRNVASNGFGRGIVDVKYDDFARYLRTHAQVVRSTPDGLEAECRIGEKDHMIFLERERTGGRDTGSTRVSISIKISFDWNDPKIGEILIDLYRPFIKTRSDAENAALAVYWRALGLFVRDTKAGGEMKQGVAMLSRCPVHPKGLRRQVSRGSCVYNAPTDPGFGRRDDARGRTNRTSSEGAICDRRCHS